VHYSVTVQSRGADVEPAQLSGNQKPVTGSTGMETADPNLGVSVVGIDVWTSGISGSAF
jgi:hypothetical protein